MNSKLKKGLSGLLACSMLFTTAFSTAGFSAVAKSDAVTKITVMTAKSKAQNACLKLKNYKKYADNIELLARLSSSANKAVYTAVKSGTAAKNIQGYNFLVAVRNILEKNAEAELLTLVGFNAKIDADDQLIDYIPSDELKQMISTVKTEVVFALNSGVPAKSILNYERIAKANAKYKSLVRAEIAASAVEELIKALPSSNALKSSDKPKVEEARYAYEKLSKFRKALIEPSNLSTLTIAEKAVAANKPDAKPSAFNASDAVAVNSSQIKITFSGDVDVTSASNVRNYTFTANNAIRDISNRFKVSVDKNTAVLTFDSDINALLGISSGSAFTLNVNYVKNTAGIQAELKSFNLTASRDTSAPTVTSARYIPGNNAYGPVSLSDNRNGLIVVTFSEPVTIVSNAPDNKIKIYDGNVNKTGEFLSSSDKVTYLVNSSNTGELIIKILGTKTIPNGEYVLSFSDETVKDLSSAANINRAASIGLKVEGATAVTGISVPKPIQFLNGSDIINDNVALSTSFDVITASGQPNKVKVRFSDIAGLNETTLRNSVNYTLFYSISGFERTLSATGVSLDSYKMDGTKIVDATVIVTFDAAVTTSVKPKLGIRDIKNIEDRTMTSTLLEGASGSLAIYNK